MVGFNLYFYFTVNIVLPFCHRHELVKHIASLISVYILITRDCPINRTCRLIAHSTSVYDDRLQFLKIDYFKFFGKNKLYLEIAY